MLLELIALTSFGIASAAQCGVDVPPLGSFDYERAGSADCQLKYWESISPTDFFMNKTYRYFDGTNDVTDFFTGEAVLDPLEGAAHWVLTLSQGDVYHISMVETDYSSYAAYVECDEVNDRNFAVISSTSLDPMDQEMVDRLRMRFAEMGAHIDGFVEVHHDDGCRYDQGARFPKL